MVQGHMASIMVFLSFYCTHNFAFWSLTGRTAGGWKHGPERVSENGVAVDVKVP
jgi:hypothetical protein